MNDGVAKRVISAFFAGGCVGLATQVVFMLLSGALGELAMLAMPLTLVAMSAVAGVLVVTGAYEKLDRVGHMGLGMTLPGLISGMAGLYQFGASQGGERAGLKASLKLAFFVFVCGGFCAAVVGVVYAMMG